MPYWRLSGFYFFYFATLGALVFYWNPYLHSLGYNDAEIGELMAIIMGTRIIAPNIWGYFADRSGKRMQIVRITSLFCVLCFIGVFFASGYWWMVVVMATYSFFWNASLPQFEATTLNHLGEDTNRYNHIRIWGSIGFIVLVVVLGYAFDTISYSYLPWVMCFLLTFIYVFSLLVPEKQIDVDFIDNKPLWQSIKRPEVIYLLLVVCLLQVSHGPYYFYFVRYMKLFDYSHALIGVLIAIGVLAEIFIFLLMRRLLICFGHRSLILIALTLTTMRWLLIAVYPANLNLLILTQTLHAASFGVMHVVSIELIHRYFVGPHQGRGQALYSSISFGLGGVLGSLYCGYVWQAWGEQTQGSVLFYSAALISFIALLVAWKGVEKGKRT